MKTVIWAMLAALLAGAIGFYVGVTYQKSQAENVQAGGQNGAGGAGQGGVGSVRGNGRMGDSVTAGAVIAKNATSITIQTPDGGSKKVFLSADTRYSRQQPLTAADIRVGDQVTAAGEAASGGINARSVAVVPLGSEPPVGGPESGEATQPAP